jgi:hypothetical protein
VHGWSRSCHRVPPDGDIPVAIRLGTSDAQQALDKVREAGVTLHNQELVRMEGVPAMFSFTDPMVTVWSTWRRPTRARQPPASSAKEYEHG